MAIIEVALGTERLVVNTDKITYPKVIELSDELSQLKKKYSLFSEYPMEEGETVDSWYERVAPLLDEKNKKKTKESAEDYINRIFKADLQKQELVIDGLRAIAKVFDNQDSKLTEEAIAVLPYVKAKNFIKQILEICDLEFGAFS